MKIDTFNFYDKLATNLLELIDKDQSSNNDAKFVDLNKFKKELNSQFHTIKKNYYNQAKGKRLMSLSKKKHLLKIQKMIVIQLLAPYLTI